MEILLISLLLMTNMLLILTLWNNHNLERKMSEKRDEKPTELTINVPELKIQKALSTEERAEVKSRNDLYKKQKEYFEKMEQEEKDNDSKPMHEKTYSDLTQLTNHVYDLFLEGNIEEYAKEAAKNKGVEDGD